MTKREREDERVMYRQLEALGLDIDDIDTLQRVSTTLHRWAERECNGEIERDDETGRVYGTNAGYTTGMTIRWRVPDRETGALKRARAIIAKHPDLWLHHQGDPRGCALYVGRVADLAPYTVAHLNSLYTRGVAIC